MTAVREQWMTAFLEGPEPSAAARRSAARAAARAQATRYYGREATARVAQVGPEVVPSHTQSELQPPSPPRLKVVTRRRPRRGALATVILLTALVLAVGIVCPVLVGSSATGVESEIGRVEKRGRDLAAQVSVLSAQVAALSAPERVAEQAVELGLGPAAKVHYVEPAAFAVKVEGDAAATGRRGR